MGIEKQFTGWPGTNVGHGVQEEVERARKESEEAHRREALRSAVEQKRRELEELYEKATEPNAPPEMRRPPLPPLPGAPVEEWRAYSAELNRRFGMETLEVREATPEEQRAALEAAAERCRRESYPPLQATAVYAAPFEDPDPTESSDHITITSIGTMPERDNWKELREGFADAFGVSPEAFEYLRPEEIHDWVRERIGHVPEEGEESITDEGQLELYDPDTTAKPHPEAPQRLRRTMRHTNLPGGFLLSTRDLERWVIDNFIPMQDRITRIEGMYDRLVQLIEGTFNDNEPLAKSRIGRLEQLVREIRAEMK